MLLNLLEAANSATEMDESWEQEIAQSLIKHPARVKIYVNEKSQFKTILS